jgi:chaperonin cofactor prefoldin
VPLLSPLLPDEKQRLGTHIAALERQNKELKAQLAELKTAQRTKATSATLKGNSNT